MFKDLQIQILEDIISYPSGFDFETHYPTYHIYARDAIVERKRPEGLIDLIQQHAENDCSSTDLCMTMGLVPSQGNLTSVGMALSKLGWKKYKTYRSDGGTLWKWKKEA